MSKEMLGRIKQLLEQNDILQELTKELAKLGLVRSKELRSLQADNKALREALEAISDIDNIIKDVNGDK